MGYRGGWMFLGASAFTGMLAVWSSLASCRSETSGSSGSTGGGGSASTNSGGAGGAGVTAVTAASSGSGGGIEPKTVTIQDITGGVVAGPGTIVKVTGVVATSQKFFITKGSSGSCLWGVFVSAPGLTETAPNTGTMVASLGTTAKTPADGGTPVCPRFGLDVPGDKIPDDIKPGDVIDVVGKADYFLLTSQCTKPTDSKVPQYQIKDVTSLTKMGTAPVPTPHELTPEEVTKLISQSDKQFYDQWGGVKVRIKGVTSIPQTDAMGLPSVADKFGKMIVTGGDLVTSTLQVPDKFYFRAALKDTNLCYRAPTYPSPATMFTSIDGIIYMDFCTWSLEPNDKCADLNPFSSDCTDATTCAPK